MAFTPDEVYGQDSWRGIANDPKKREGAQGRMFSWYLQENPDRAEFYKNESRRSKKKIRNDFSQRLVERNPEAWGPEPEEPEGILSRALGAVRDAVTPDLSRSAKPAVLAPASSDGGESIDFTKPYQPASPSAGRQTNLPPSVVSPPDQRLEFTPYKKAGGAESAVVGAAEGTYGTLLAGSAATRMVGDYWEHLKGNVRQTGENIKQTIAPKLFERERVISDERALAREDSIASADPNLMQKTGEAAYDFYLDVLGDIEKAYPHGDITRDPSLMVDPAHFFRGVSQAAVSLSQAALVSGGLGKAGQLGSKTRLISGGAVVGGGIEAIPGFYDQTEGSITYDVVSEDGESLLLRGGTEEEADSVRKEYPNSVVEKVLPTLVDPTEAFARTLLFWSTVYRLEKIGLGKIFAGKSKNKIVRALAAAGGEGLSEALEEPADTIITRLGAEGVTPTVFGNEVLESTRRGANVFLSSFFVGGGMSMLQGSSSDQERKVGGTPASPAIVAPSQADPVAPGRSIGENATAAPVSPAAPAIDVNKPYRRVAELSVVDTENPDLSHVAEGLELKVFDEHVEKVIKGELGGGGSVERAIDRINDFRMGKFLVVLGKEDADQVGEYVAARFDAQAPAPAAPVDGGAAAVDLSDADVRKSKNYKAHRSSGFGKNSSLVRARREIAEESGQSMPPLNEMLNESLSKEELFDDIEQAASAAEVAAAAESHHEDRTNGFTPDPEESESRRSLRGEIAALFEKRFPKANTKRFRDRHGYSVFDRVADSLIADGVERDKRGKPVTGGTFALQQVGNAGGGSAGSGAVLEGVLEEVAELLSLPGQTDSTVLAVAPAAPVSGGAGPVAPADPVIETPVFKRRFGQSKVVDDNGSPLVVHHGTEEKFDSFDNSKAADGAFFFTGNEAHAGHFGDVGSYYLRIDNPLEIAQIDLENAWDRHHGIPEGGDSSNVDTDLIPRDFVSDFVKQAKAAGNDGVVIRDMADLHLQETVYLPLDPSQIILAGQTDSTVLAVPTSRQQPSLEEIGDKGPAIPDLAAAAAADRELRPDPVGPALDAAADRELRFPPPPRSLRRPGALPVSPDALTRDVIAARVLDQVEESDLELIRGADEQNALIHARKVVRDAGTGVLHSGVMDQEEGMAAAYTDFVTTDGSLDAAARELVDRARGVQPSTTMIDVPQRDGTVRQMPLPEIEGAETPWDTEEIIGLRKAQESIVQTMGIDTPERRQMRAEWAAKDYGSGAPVKGKELHLVLGLPGSGKSGVIVKRLIKERGAKEIDADTIKPVIPENAGGDQAGAVHSESSFVAIQMVYARALANGDNIVLSKIGSDAGKIQEIIDDAKRKGYKVGVYFVDVSLEESAKRVQQRYLDTGRFVDVKIVQGYGLKPRGVFDKIKLGKDIEAYEAWDNNGPIGSTKLIETGGKGFQSLRSGSGQHPGSGQEGGPADSQGEIPGSELDVPGNSGVVADEGRIQSSDGSVLVGGPDTSGGGSARTATPSDEPGRQGARVSPGGTGGAGQQGSVPDAAVGDATGRRDGVGDESSDSASERVGPGSDAVQRERTGKARNLPTKAPSRLNNPDLTPAPPEIDAAAVETAQAALEELPAERRNHRIKGEDVIILAGPKTKATANARIIDLVKKLTSLKRLPTPEEKKLLAQYVGWGQLPDVLDSYKAKYGDEAWKKKWGSLYNRVKKLLTDEEWRLAERSTLNAHYTDRGVINGMWDLVRHLGFEGGQIGEFGAGVGHFNGLQPDDIAAKSSWTMVEKDGISGQILRLLYPQDRVVVGGLEGVDIPSHSLDLVVGNVPFAKDGPTDKRYPEFSLHNYFFARSIDALRPGGMLVLISSTSTMDNQASFAARKWMSERADLVGAVRLPNNAFKKNAGTEVTTDIIVLRKRDGSAFPSVPWLNAREIDVGKGETTGVNEYFARHPEMMLGDMRLEGSLYGANEAALIAPKGQNLEQSLKDVVSQFPSAVIGRVAPRAVDVVDSNVGEAAEGSESQLIVRDKKVYQVENGTLSVPTWTKQGARVKRAVAFVGLRDQMKSLIDMQRGAIAATDGEIEAARANLNDMYEKHVSERDKKGGLLNGYISNSTKHGYLEEDPEYPLVLALEKVSTRLEKTETGSRHVEVVEKADILTKRTQWPHLEPTTAETPEDALGVSVAYRGSLDLEYMAGLTGITSDAVEESLKASGVAFIDPVSGALQEKGEYLSGNVRKKLDQARQAAESDASYQGNVEALEAVQPTWIPLEQVELGIGARFVSPEIYAKFLMEKLALTADIRYSPATDRYEVDVRAGQLGPGNIQVWGTERATGDKLMRNALNLKTTTIYDTWKEDGKDKKAQNVQLTMQASLKQQELMAEFETWIRSKGEFREELEGAYNTRYNSYVIRRYRGPSWDYYPGMAQNPGKKPRDHQKGAITRNLQGSTLDAHGVGTGKTIIQAATAMEMRRLGLAKKPMIVVQNATLNQFGASFKQLYPSAKLLVPGKKLRTAKNRKRFVAMVATGDWDAIIIPQSFFVRIPDSDDRIKAFMAKETEELRQAKYELAHLNAKNPRVKDINRALGNLEKRLSKLLEREVDQSLTFEQLGVDALLLDEAHAYKKLEFQTQMENLKGLDKGASQQALSAFMKVRHVQDGNNGRNVIMSTGTPLSNTLAEAWTMIRFVRPDLLEAHGIQKFDQFASTFGNTINTIEQTAGGTFKAVKRFAKYKNIPELNRIFHSAADVILADMTDIPGIPVHKNGQPTSISVERSAALGEFIENVLRRRLEEFEAMGGAEKRKNSHIPLVTYGQGRKATLDMRLIDSAMPDEEGSKLNRAVAEVFTRYEASTDVLGTQLVFADLYQSPDEKFNLYADFKAKLVARGVPADEVAAVIDYKTDDALQKLFAQVKAGQIRVLLGSTEKMGVGVNVQNKVIAVHHLDAPSRPMDITQRNGRAFRQKNENAVVEELRYGVLNTLDSTLYQRLSIKARLFDPVLRGQMDVRTVDDVGEDTLGFEEQMALYSGNPLAVEKIGVEAEVKRLEASRRNFVGQQASARSQVEVNKRTMEGGREHVAKTRPLIDAFKEKVFGDVWGVVDGVEHQDKKKLYKAIDASVSKAIAQVVKDGAGKIQSILDIRKPGPDLQPFGLDLKVVVVARADMKTGLLDEGSAVIEWTDPESGSTGMITTGVGLIRSLKSSVKTREMWLENHEADQVRLEQETPELEALLTQEFADKDALDVASDRLAEIEQTFADEASEAATASRERRQEAGGETVPAESQVGRRFKVTRKQGAEQHSLNVAHLALERKYGREGMERIVDALDSVSSESGTIKDVSTGDFIELVESLVNSDYVIPPVNTDPEGLDPLELDLEHAVIGFPDMTQNNKRVPGGSIHNAAVTADTEPETLLDFVEREGEETAQRMEKGAAAGAVLNPFAGNKRTAGDSVGRALEAGRVRPDNIWARMRIGISKLFSGFDEGFVTFMPHLNDNPKMRNDYRTQFMPMRRRVYDQYGAVRATVFGELERAEKRAGVNKAMDIFWTKDLIRRSQDGQEVVEGLTEKELQDHLTWLESEASPEVLRAAGMLRRVTDIVGQSLVDRGKLSEMDVDYAPHAVIDYIPGFMLTKGNVTSAMQQEFGDPYRGYTRKAVGSKRLIETSETTLWSHLVKVTLDNSMEDWFMEQANRYDRRQEWQAQNPGVKLANGDPVEIDGKRYRAMRWKRNFYTATAVNESLLDFARKDDLRVREWESLRGKQGGAPLRDVRAVGKDELYLFPDEVFSTMKNLIEKTGPMMDMLYSVNRITRHWKAITLISAGLPYHAGNLIGDSMNLAMFDPGAVKYMPASWRVATAMFFPKRQKNPLTPFEEQVMREAVQQDVAYSGPFSEVRAYGLGTKGAKLYHSLSDFREALARMAILAHQLDRSNKGYPVQSGPAINISGLSPAEQAGKVAREGLVDYVAVPLLYKRILSQFAAPFLRFHEANARNHLRMAVKLPQKYWWKLAVPYLAAFWWNNGDDDQVEKELKLPDYLRNRLHLILWDGEDKDTVWVWAPQQPVDMAASWLGLDNLGRIVSDVVAGEATAQEGAELFAREILSAPGDTLKGIQGPILQIIEGLKTNKDPFSNRKVMPNDLHKEWLQNNLEWRAYSYLVSYVTEKMLTPIAQYTRHDRSTEPSEVPVWNALAHGPLDFKRALGFYKVDLRANDLAKEYREASSARAVYAFHKDRIYQMYEKRGMAAKPDVDRYMSDLIGETGIDLQSNVKGWLDTPAFNIAIAKAEMRKTDDQAVRDKWRGFIQMHEAHRAARVGKSLPKAVR